MTNAPSLSPDKKADEVKALLTAEIEHRRKWNSRDFQTVHYIGWISLISSAVATIFTAYGPGDGIGKLFLAVLTTLPGLMVAIESSFKFSFRQRLNSDLMYDLMLLRSSLQGGKDPYEVERDYFSTMTKFNDLFSKLISVPTLPTPKD